MVRQKRVACIISLGNYAILKSPWNCCPEKPQCILWGCPFDRPVWFLDNVLSSRPPPKPDVPSTLIWNLKRKRSSEIQFLASSLQWNYAIYNGIKSLDMVGSDAKLATDRWHLNLSIFTLDTHHEEFDHIFLTKTSLSPILQVPIQLKNF